METLDLVLKGKWFDMIKEGIKREEYREIKPYWTKRLFSKNFNIVKFRRGYTKNSLTFKITDIYVGKGNADIGAPDYDVYIIKFE